MSFWQRQGVLCFRLGTGVTNVGVEGGEQGEHEEKGEKNQYRWYYLDNLDQYAGQGPPQWLEAEGEEAKDAVYSPL